MRIAVIGTGYVGLVSGACLSEMGNSVICVDVDEKKIENLKKGILPIYEPGLEEIVENGVKTESLHFTTDIKEALEKSDIIFVAVGTPMGEDGSADLKYVLSVAESVGKYMIHPLTIVDKSTVPVGTAEKVRAVIEKELEKRGEVISFHVVSNPEFLKEGAAIEDFKKPDRVVIGADNEEALEIMKELYKPFTRNHERFVAMGVRSAEMTKYAANSMLATKISFMNEISNICEKVGADVNDVRVGIGSDSRIGYSFIYPGCGYGGSCFPKDVRALERLAAEHGYTTKVLRSVQEVNEAQKEVLVRKITKRFGEDLTGKTLAVWGLAFKPETDDMREASSVVLIKELVKRGARVQAYDPKAQKEAEECYLKGVANVAYFDSKYSALDGAEAMVLVTEWKEFRSPDWLEIEKRLKEKIIFDGRNIYDHVKMAERGFEYFCIGRA